MKSIIVFYHIKDNDGLGSAWAAWRKLKEKADYFGIDYHFDHHFDYKGKTIYFLDFRPSDKVIALLKQNKNHLVLVDHHISSKNKLKLFDEYKFDAKHSAAVLTWQYFFPHKKIPKILLYIEDMDIWKLKLSFSRDINNVIELYDGNFKHWNKLVRDLEDFSKRKEYIKVGKIISQYQDKLIQKIAAKAKLVKFEGKKVFAVNSSILISEVGNTLVRKRSPLAIIWSEIDKKVWFSLRSNGSCDVSKIAEKYGGGGQKGAAAFMLDINAPLPWQKIQ
jgi:nanoRNase/pAp phosphatase (c-di-AMP/oligoRNAs hydrolase)